MSSDTIIHKVKDPNEEERKEWTINTAANGLTYYYNIKTKKSTWTKPDCLKSLDEKYNSTDWQEYTTSDGKTFYHNAKLKKSLWKMPPELKALKDKQAEERKSMANKNDSKTNLSNPFGKIQFSITSSIQEDPDDHLPKQQLYNPNRELNKEESTKLFMDLLREKNIGPPMKWEQCQNLLSSDDRYNVIKGIGEKKRLFNEFIQMAKKAERNEVRNKIEQAKENFVTMLENSQFLTSESKFHKVAVNFIHDPRWKVVEDRDREILFQDYLDELFNKEKEDNRIKRKDNIERFKSSLFEKKDMNSQMKWEECGQLFKDDSIFNSLIPFDQLVAFSEVILQLEQKEYEERRRVKRYNERKKREAFRNLLENYENRNELVYKTKWKDFVQKIKDEPCFIDMLGQPGSTPRELFEDHLEFMRENHKKIKDELKRYLKTIHFKVLFDTCKEEFDLKMKNNELFSNLTESKRNYYYQYCINKAKSKEKEVFKKHKKASKKFKKLLKSLKEITFESNLEQFKEIIDENASHYNILNEEDKLNIFNEYKANLEKIENNGDDEIKNRLKKRKKKKSKDQKIIEVFNSNQDELKSEERLMFEEKYKKKFENDEKQRKIRKETHKRKRDNSYSKKDESEEKIEIITKKQKIEENDNYKLMEEFKKLSEEINKIENLPIENQKEEIIKLNIPLSEEKNKEEGELDIKKPEKFLNEEEEDNKKKEDLKKKKSLSRDSKSSRRKSKDRKNKKRIKKDHKRKDKRRSKSISKSRKKRKGYSSSSESDSN